MHPTSRTALTCAASLLVMALPASAQPGDGHKDGLKRTSVLRELSDSVAAIVRRVSPSVVQVQVTAFVPRDGADRDGVLDNIQQSTVGSGVIVDPDGYAVTNAHLLTNAVRVQVVLPGPWDDEPSGPSAGAGEKILDARIVAEMKDLDLAVLKIDATHLPALPIGN